MSPAGQRIAATGLFAHRKHGWGMNQKPNSKLYQFRLVFYVLAASLVMGIIGLANGPHGDASDFFAGAFGGGGLVLAFFWGIHQFVRGLEEGGNDSGRTTTKCNTPP